MGDSLSFLSAREAAQFVGVERDAEPRFGRQVDVKIREAQWLRHQVFRQYLWAEMFAAPRQRPEAGENLQVRRRTDRTLQQAAAIQPDPAASATAATLRVASKPPCLTSFKDTTSAAPACTAASMSCAENTHSSAMSGTVERYCNRAIPAKFQSGGGCSTSAISR